MDYNKQHPLSQITSGNSFSMLEMMIPYIDHPFKLPLALLIKFNEIRMIIYTLQHIDLARRFGLYNDNNTPADMLSALIGISPEMLQMLMSLSESGFSDMGTDFPNGFQNLFQNFDTSCDAFCNNNSCNANPENNFNNYSQTSTTNNTENNYNFDDRINHIFENYDNHE